MDARRIFRTGWRGLVVMAMLGLSLATSTGCIGLMAHALWAAKGERVPAEYTGLEGERVAVVCLSSTSAFGPDDAARVLAASVHAIFEKRVKKIRLVHPDEVANWIDHNDWKQIDYREIGRGVKAEKIVAIDLGAHSLHEGRTLFKGTAKVTVSVYDMQEEGKLVFRRTTPEFTYPETGGYPTTDMSEPEFRRAFLGRLARHIARPFHEHDLVDHFATDAESIGRVPH